MPADPAWWAGKRVLVTGGAGFLGSGLCHALAALGAEVVALDAMLTGSAALEANLDGLPARLLRADLRDADLAEACEGVDVLFNLAAQTSHAGGQRDPATDVAINTTAQIRLILAMRVAAPEAVVVHASTRQFYGKPQYLPVNEAHPIAPPDANGVSKFAGEQYWMLEHRVHGRPVVSLRLTNCYGPRMRIIDARQTFVGIWLRRVIERTPFEVWGGTQMRDLTYLDDVTAAFLLAAERSDCHGRVFNLGGGPPVTLLELADAVVAANGGGEYVMREFPAEAKAIDIGSYHADDSAFRAASGWAPRIGLAEGLARSLDFFRPRMAEYIDKVPT